MARQIDFRRAGWSSLDTGVLREVVASLELTQRFFHKAALWENWDEEIDCEGDSAAAPDDDEAQVDSCTHWVRWHDTELVLAYSLSEVSNLEQTLSSFDAAFWSVTLPELIPLSLLAFAKHGQPPPPEFGPTLLKNTMERLRRVLLGCCPGVDALIFSEGVRHQILDNLQHAHMLHASQMESRRTIRSQVAHWMERGAIPNDPSLQRQLQDAPNCSKLSAKEIVSSAGWARTADGRERGRRVAELLTQVGDLLRDEDGSTHKLMMLVVLTDGLCTAVDRRNLQG